MLKNIIKIALSTVFVFAAQASASKRTVLDVVVSIKPLQAIITGYVAEYVKESWMQKNNIVSCACSADNSYVAVAYKGSAAVSLFDIQTKKLMRVINNSVSLKPTCDGSNPLYPENIVDLAFSPDGKYLACGTDKGNILVWDAPACLTCQWKDGAQISIQPIATLTMFTKFDDPYCRRIRSLMFSNDSEYLLQHNTDIRIMNFSTHGVIHVPDSSGVEYVSYYGKKNNFVATHNQLTSCEAGLVVWDNCTLKVKQKIVREELEISKIAASRDGKYLALASISIGAVKILLQSDLSVVELFSYGHNVLKLEFGPDNALYVVTRNGIDRWSSLESTMVAEDSVSAHN